MKMKHTDTALRVVLNNADDPATIVMRHDGRAVGTVEVDVEAQTEGGVTCEFLAGEVDLSEMPAIDGIVLYCTGHGSEVVHYCTRCDTYLDSSEDAALHSSSVHHRNLTDDRERSYVVEVERDTLADDELDADVHAGTEA